MFRSRKCPEIATPKKTDTCSRKNHQKRRAPVRYSKLPHPPHIWKSVRLILRCGFVAIIILGDCGRPQSGHRMPTIFDHRFGRTPGRSALTRSEFWVLRGKRFSPISIARILLAYHSWRQKVRQRKRQTEPGSSRRSNAALRLPSHQKMA